MDAHARPEDYPDEKCRPMSNEKLADIDWDTMDTLVTLRAWLCVRFTPSKGSLDLHRRRDRIPRALKQRGPK